MITARFSFLAPAWPTTWPTKQSALAADLAMSSHLSRYRSRLPKLGLIALLIALLVPFAPHGRAELHIATWNVAWLRSAPLSDADYERCKRLTFEQRANLDDRHPMRWICRNAGHYAELGAIAARVQADVLAFQEVESVEALGRILPREQFEFYVTDSPWIQRVGFAVRKGRAQVLRFEGYAALGAVMAERPRSGADLSLRVDGVTMRLLAVHLKSACHARPLTDESRPPRSLPDEPPACLQLAQQVKPLEAWIDARVREKTPFIVLGDFNRRFDAPAERELPARDARGRQQSIWREINDDDPPGARLVRLTEGRTQARACRAGDPKLSDAERGMYIDHIIVSEALAAAYLERSLWQWPLVEGKSIREARAHARELSDHCPLSARFRLR